MVASTQNLENVYEQNNDTKVHDFYKKLHFQG